MGRRKHNKTKQAKTSSCFALKTSNNLETRKKNMKKKKSSIKSKGDRIKEEIAQIDGCFAKIEKEMIPEAQKNSPEENENGKNPSKPYRCEVPNLEPVSSADVEAAIENIMAL